MNNSFNKDSASWNTWTALQREALMFDLFKNVKVEDLKLLSGPVVFGWCY